jgi:hypothetical protein
MDSQQLDQTTKLLRATFLTNLAVLQVHMPNVHEFFRNYQAQTTLLAIDANGEVNLARDGQQIYPDSPRDSSREQVDVFIRDPKTFRYFPQEGRPKGYEHYLQIQTLEQIAEQAKAYPSYERYLSPLDVDQAPDCLCILGAGLGYHLEMLAEQLDAAYVYLFEPEPDCFFAMLHTVDLRPIIQKCQARGGFMKITIGGAAETFVNEINAMLTQRGPFNLARMLIYRHYYGDDINNAFQMIHDLAYRYVGGWGFFEDEAISIAHSLSHVENNIPFLRKPNPRDRESQYPVFIVGNGPSLDKTIDLIKQYRNNAIVISCGSALRSLSQQGIVPDIHIEVERTYHVYDWLRYAAIPEVFEHSILIGPNTLHPQVVGLFKRKCLYIKPNDSGGDLIQNAAHRRYLDLYFCAPTVTNGAAAVAVALGFKNLFLFGADYGFRSDEYHHSKDSAYYQKEWKGETTKMAGHLEVEASRGDTVFTTPVFDLSRGVMEMLLEKHPVQCFNLSDGAKIQGATFIDPDLPIDAGMILTEVERPSLEQLLTVRFDALRNENHAIKSRFYDDFHRLEKLTLMLMDVTRGANTPNDRIALHRAFSTQYSILQKAQDDPNLIVSYRLLKGTFCYIQTTIMSFAYAIRDAGERQQFIHQALNVFNTHLIELCEKLADNYETHDNTSAFNS